MIRNLQNLRWKIVGKYHFYENWEIMETVGGSHIRVGICPNSRVDWKVNAMSCIMTEYWKRCNPCPLRKGKKVHLKWCKSCREDCEFAETEVGK